MLVHTFQGIDIVDLKNQVSMLTSKIPASPKFILQSQSTVNVQVGAVRVDRALVTITVCYE